MPQQSDEGEAGKYLLFEVPNFNNATSDDASLSSYLRLGAVKDLAIAGAEGAPRASGEDLAAKVKTFIDDTRMRDGCPEFIPEPERQNETAKLHTKGGWRDHSDGNRITTTRGDKVEVIKGNYRMLILGRQDHDSGWDVSGGHVAETGITFAGSSEIRWVQNYDGTWRVIEETIKGDVFTTYQGDTHDKYYGSLKDSTTGSESPAKGRENPRITDRTWAVAIESRTGSASLPVPVIKDETWADDISSKTIASSVSDKTEVSGSIGSSTTAGSISDTTSAGSMTSTTSAGSIVDTTMAGAMVSTTLCPISIDTTVGETVSVIVGEETEIVVGKTGEITIGEESSLTLGAVIDITLALMLDVCIAGKLEVNIGASWKFDGEANFNITPSSVKQAVEKVEALGSHASIADLHSFF